MSNQLSPVEFGISIYLLLYLLFSTYQFGFQLSSTSLSPSDREPMQWVRTHTPDNSKFLVLTGTDSVTCDMVLEWFPALADRRSLYTVQGTEWIKGANFKTYVQSTYAVQKCLSSADVSCLDANVSRSEYDFVYISKIPRVNCKPVDLPNAFSPFLDSLRTDNGFHLIYETEAVVIFGK